MTNRATLLGMGSVTAIINGTVVGIGDLGTMALENAADYFSKAGNLSGVADAAAARVNLGVTIGSAVQAWDTDLDWVAANLTATGKTLVGAANAAAVRTAAGVVIGTDVQAWDTDLDWVAANLTATGKTLVGAANAAAVRTAAGVVIGTDVQAFNSNLTTWAGKTVPSGTVVGTSDTQSLTNKTYNGNTFTSGTGTLTLGASKTLTASNTLTFTGTDGSSVAFGAGGTAAYTANKLSAFAATTSAELAGVISDETGSGALVFGTSPTISGLTGTGVAQFAELRSNQGASPNVANLFVGYSGGSVNYYDANVHHIRDGQTAALIDVSTTAVQFPVAGTTATAANAVLDAATSNRLLRSTSSLVYKRVLGELAMDDAYALVLGSRAIRYQSMSDDDNPFVEHVGFGAEDVARLDERFITRRADGSPDWVQYPAYAAPLCCVVADIHARLQRVEQLTETL